MTSVHMTLAQANAMSPAVFVASFGDIAEHSPWVAEAAATERPFADREAMINAFATAIETADRSRQRALLLAHPDLAGRAAIAGDLTEDSRPGAVGGRARPAYAGGVRPVHRAELGVSPSASDTVHPGRARRDEGSDHVGVRGAHAERAGGGVPDRAVAGRAHRALPAGRPSEGLTSRPRAARRRAPGRRSWRWRRSPTRSVQALRARSCRRRSDRRRFPRASGP